jgi:peptidoglycan-associated lipoprotein
MRVPYYTKFALRLAALAVSIAPSIALAASPPANGPVRPELALSYSYLRSNAPPGGCTCFNLNGGSATFAWPLKDHFAIVGDITAATGSGITATGYSLTLSSYTGGARYSYKLGRTLQPFGQALIGVAHSSGSLVQGPTASVANSAASFAANLGGGLDIPLNRRFSLRPIEADYLLTTFNNGSNNRQNNLRISAGLVFRF